MSDIERYWEAIRKKCNPMPPPWNSLSPMKQMMVVQSINLLIQAINE